MPEPQTQQAPQTLAGMVRTKHPGAYDDLDDATLENKVLTKYPEYSDLPRTQAASDAGPNATLGKATGLSAPPKPFTLPWVKQGLWRAAANTADVAPAAGATIGGMVGAPAGPEAAVGGAGFGGMAGASAQQIMRRMLGLPAPTTSAEAAKDITKQGLTQGAIQGATELMPLAAPFLKNSAVSQYEKALAPTTKANKAITQKIVPDLIERGEHGSLEGLSDQASQQAGALKPQLDAAYTATPTTATAGSGTKIIQDLENLKGRYVVNGQPANPQAVNAISGIQDIVKQYGADIDPNSLRKLKSVFDDPVAQSGGYAGSDLGTKYTLKAQKVAANSIRGIMSQASPDVAALNKEITFWLNVQKVTDATSLRQSGQAGGLMKVLSPLAAGSAASATGLQFGAHAGLEAGAGTALTIMAVQAMRSPMWRTASAILKDRFANALARGSVGDAAALLARLGVAAQGATTGNQRPNPTMPWQPPLQQNQ